MTGLGISLRCRVVIGMVGILVCLVWLFVVYWFLVCLRVGLLFIRLVWVFGFLGFLGVCCAVGLRVAVWWVVLCCFVFVA